MCGWGCHTFRYKEGDQLGLHIFTVSEVEKWATTIMASSILHKDWYLCGFKAPRNQVQAADVNTITGVSVRRPGKPAKLKLHERFLQNRWVLFVHRMQRKTRYSDSCINNVGLRTWIDASHGCCINVALLSEVCKMCQNTMEDNESTSWSTPMLNPDTFLERTRHIKSNSNSPVMSQN